MRTVMHSHRQVFPNYFSATRALLRRVARVNKHALSTSVLSFVLSEPYQLVPRGVTDTPVERCPSATSHTRNVEVFKHDDLIIFNKFPTEFVGEVDTSVLYPFVDMLDYTLAFLPCLAALFRRREPTLRLLEFFKFRPEEARVLHLFTIREGSEVLQPEVDADNF